MASTVAVGAITTYIVTSYTTAVSRLSDKKLWAVDDMAAAVERDVIVVKTRRWTCRR